MRRKALLRRKTIGKLSGLFFTFRYSTMDIAIDLCFGKDIHPSTS
jgi:hypothetical protein